MSYQWFKLFHDLPNDIKLRKFSAQEKWAWVALLCLASQGETRGVVVGSNDDLADYCEFNTTQDFLYYRDKLIGKGMAEINSDGNLEILNWQKRQSRKPSDSPERVKQRVEKHRKTSKELIATPCNAPVTPCNVSVTPPDLELDLDPDLDLEKNHYLQIAHAISNLEIPNPNPDDAADDDGSKLNKPNPLPGQSNPELGVVARPAAAPPPPLLDLAAGRQALDDFRRGVTRNAGVWRSPQERQEFKSWLQKRYFGKPGAYIQKILNSLETGKDDDLCDDLARFRAGDSPTGQPPAQPANELAALLRDRGLSGHIPAEYRDSLNGKTWTRDLTGQETAQYVQLLRQPQ